MNLIQFFNSGDSSGASLKAVKPVVYQKYLTIETGTGLTAQDLLPALGAGSCAAYGGQIVNNGCYDLKVLISYLEGGDCDSCTVDTLTVSAVELFIPKNSVFPLPDGFYQQIQVQTVDSSKNPIANTTDVSISLHSSHVPNCNGCVQAIAGVPCGVFDTGQFSLVDDGTDVNPNVRTETVLGFSTSAELQIWALDNNFNFKVNGTAISAFDELNFLAPADLTVPYPNSANLAFSDGTLLFGGAPWGYPADAVEPLVKVTIDAAGVVTVKGLKSDGVYEDFVVPGGWKTVPVNLGCTSSNVFEFTQSTVNNPTEATAKIVAS